MTLVDRYLLFLFFKVFLVCFLSFTGLYVVIHLFSNLDELTALSHSTGWPQLMWDFYSPRVAEIFDKTAAIWTLLAAAFSVSLMQRRREMTAIEAAGITKSRILRSIFASAFVIIIITLVNRELIIPAVKDQLVRTPQNWNDQDQITLNAYHDVESGVKIRDGELSLVNMNITEPDIQLPRGIGAPSNGIQAMLATVEPETESHPAGLMLYEIVSPPPEDLPASIYVDGMPLVYWPSDQAWLQPNQCFVVCEFDAYSAAYGKKLQAYLSFPEMMTELRKPRLWFGKSQQLNIHARVMQPFLDFALILLGLPLIVARSEKNAFVSAGLCFLIVGALQSAVIISHSLGTYSLIQPIALAAWLPAILFVPCSLLAIRSIDR